MRSVSWQGWLLSNPPCTRHTQLVTPAGLRTITSAQPWHQHPHIPSPVPSSTPRPGPLSRPGPAASLRTRSLWSFWWRLLARPGPAAVSSSGAAPAGRQPDQQES